MSDVPKDTEPQTDLSPPKPASEGVKNISAVQGVSDAPPLAPADNSLPAPSPPTEDTKPKAREVPRQPDTLPDGTPVMKIGDVDKFRELNHPQGQAVPGFKGTCGECSTECVLRQFGVDTTEADVVNLASANGWCITDSTPEYNGGTSPDDRAKILTAKGIPSSVEQGKNLDDLAKYVEDGRGVILATNAGHLWNDPDALGDDPSKPNHAVTLIGVARGAKTGEPVGVYINDSGNYDGGAGSGKFIDAKTMTKAWVQAGGECTVTDVSYLISKDEG